VFVAWGSTCISHPIKHSLVCDHDTYVDQYLCHYEIITHALQGHNSVQNGSRLVFDTRPRWASLVKENDKYYCNKNLFNILKYLGLLYG